MTTTIAKKEIFAFFRQKMQRAGGAEKAGVRWTAGIAEPSEQMK